jgi:hypothetical protein
VLSLHRMRESAGLLGAVLLVVALVAGLSVALLGFLAQQSTEGVQSGLAARAGSDLAMRATLPIAEDGDRQDDQVRSAIGMSFGPTGATIDVTRTLEHRVDLRFDDGSGQIVDASATAASFEDFETRTEIVDGVAAIGDEQVMVQADAALSLGIGVGDAVELDGVGFVVAGTWRPLDHLDPRWYGEPIVQAGVDAEDVGPFVIAESAWSRLEDPPDSRWTLVPDASTLTAANISMVATAWQRINFTWRGTVDDLSDLGKQSRFLQTARDIGVRVTGLAAIQPVVILLLVAIALVALAQLASLLTATRAGETALIWSRGASAADIARATAFEIGIIALAGAAVGLAAGAGVLVLLTGGIDVVAQFWPSTVVLTGGIVLAAIVLAGLSAFRAAAGQTVRDPGDASGRIRRFGAPGVVVLVIGAAALCVWQLRLYGSPVTPTESGAPGVDPVAVLAPALALIAGVLTAAVAFPAVAALADRLLRRGPVTAYLATRTVARRVSLAAAPLVVVALATGSIVISAAYGATWSQSFTRSSELRAGADLHVNSLLLGFTADDIETIRTSPGVDDVAPLEIQPVNLGDTSGSVVAVSPDALARIATDGGGSFDAAKVAELIRTDNPAPVLPAATTEVELVVAMSGFAERPQVAVWLADERGVLIRTPLELGALVPDPDRADDESAEIGTWTGQVDESLEITGEPLRLLAVDVRIAGEAVSGADTANVRMRTLTALAGTQREEIALDGYFLPEGSQFAVEWPVGDGSGLGFTAFSEVDDVRMTPSFDGTGTDQVQAPVVISQTFADTYGLEVGETVSFSLEDGIERMTWEITGIVLAIPGAPNDAAVLADLAVVQHYQLRTTGRPDIFGDAWVQTPPFRDLWISSADPVATADALRPLLPATARIESALDPAGRQVLGSAAAALWWGTAACGLLAIIAVGAASRAQLRSRRADIAVLRALGLSAREQAAVRSGEQALILGTSVVAGLLTGAAVIALTVPQLAIAAVPEPYSSIATDLVIDPVGFGLGMGALLTGLVIVVGAVRVAVAVLARRAVPEGVS